MALGLAEALMQDRSPAHPAFAVNHRGVGHQNFHRFADKAHPYGHHRTSTAATWVLFSLVEASSVAPSRSAQCSLRRKTGRQTLIIYVLMHHKIYFFSRLW